MGVEFIKDEADKRQFDGTDLKNRDPNKHYRWARDRDMAVARHNFNGYGIVDSTSDPVRSVCDESTRMKKSGDNDTAIRLGDMILMSTSKENYERRVKEEAIKVSRQTAGVTAGYKHAVDQLGGARRIGFEEHDDRRYAGEWTEKDHERQMEEEARERRRR